MAISDAARPIDMVLSRLQGVRKTGDGFTACCPHHDDHQASLSIGEGKRGEVLLKCFAGCRAEDIVSSIGLTMADLFPKDSSRSSPARKITIEDLARDKGLPVDFLKMVGVEQGIGGVKISYRLMDGKPAPRQRWRFALKAKEGSRWLGKRHDPIVPYGLWMLEKMRKHSDTLLLVEGESDCWTLWHYVIPALGIPGAEMYETLESPYVEIWPSLCIFQEPDKGGDSFVPNLCERLREIGYSGEVRVLRGETAGFKDPNDLHKTLVKADTNKSDEFLERMRDLIGRAEVIDLSQVQAKAKAAASSLALTEAENLTDLGNARRLVRLHGQDLRYCHPWKSWMIWDGKRWTRDESADVVRRAKQTVAAMYREASEIDDMKERQRFVSHALRSESSSRISAMISLAESEPGIPVLPRDFDTDLWDLNAENGTVDLRTGELRPHSRKDLATKLVSASYDLDAQCPQWLSFLDQIMGGNQGLVDYLRRVVGYTLTGDTSEQCLFLLHGTGANGKSTFLETLRALLSDYSQQAEFSTFLHSDKDKIPSDIARLCGARFVSAVEADAGRRLSESLVKQMTGGDTITARFLFEKEFEFKPTHKILLAANVKPAIRGQDNAIWRRIRLIPFEVTFKKKDQDKALPQKLRSELPGILAWAVAGCLEWQQRGLDDPAEVLNATDRYRQDMDILADFLAQCCVIERTTRTSSKALYDAYTKWCQESAEEPLSARAFGLRLKDKGFDQSRTGRVRGWLGVGLIDYEHNHQGSLVNEAAEQDEDPRINDDASNKGLPLDKEPF